MCLEKKKKEWIFTISAIVLKSVENLIRFKTLSRLP